jgi:hypothetical protein
MFSLSGAAANDSGKMAFFRPKSHFHMYRHQFRRGERVTHRKYMRRNALYPSQLVEQQSDPPFSRTVRKGPNSTKKIGHFCDTFSNASE